MHAVPPWAGFRHGGLRLCFFCYANADPTAAKMKVNAETAIVAELAKLVPGIVMAPHDVPIWDCRVPGGCSLKRPDMLFRFEDRYIQIEVAVVSPLPSGGTQRHS